MELMRDWLKYIEVMGFSWLKPNSRIPEHTDDRDPLAWTKVLHVGLLVPGELGECYLNVSEDPDGKQGATRLFEEQGRCLCFDDKFPHSAANTTSLDRVVFYLKLRVLPPNSPKYQGQDAPNSSLLDMPGELDDELLASNLLQDTDSPGSRQLVSAETL